MAAAHFDDDFALREPPRKKATRRPTGKGRKPTSRWAALRVNPKLLLKRTAIGASLLVALGIVVNALELQKGRHPAPLFGASVTIEGDSPHAATPLPVPAPRPLPQKAAVLPDPASEDAPPAHIVPPVAAPKAAASERVGGVDEIAQLLQHGSLPRASHAEPRPSHAADAPSAHPVAPHEAHAAFTPTPRTVYTVQQALVKLGFVLKPNGVYGPQTKKALALFGKDRHLPINGDLSPRVIKILAAESGLRIEHP